MTRTTRFECPLCSFEGDRTTVYVHLQRSHRKSELCRKVLTDAHGEATSLGADDAGSGTAD